MIARLMGLPTISPVEVRRMVDERRGTVIDVNARRVWADGHVPGAVNLDPERYQPDDLPADKEASLVFYCSGPLCRKAPSAARRARRLGYRDVRVMSAGISGWLSAQLPTESSGAADSFSPVDSSAPTDSSGSIDSSGSSLGSSDSSGSGGDS